MKIHHTLALIAALSCTVRGATPEQERIFVESYRKASESNDAKALAGFLLTEGCTQETVDFFTQLQAMDAGKTIVRIELVAPTAEESAHYKQPMTMPDGRVYKMPFPPSRQLIVMTEHQSSTGTSKSTSRIAVGEKNGKLVILVPVPAN